MFTLRLILFFGNIGFFIFLVWGWWDEGFDGETALIILPLMVLACLNIYYVVHNNPYRETWLGLLLKRKGLEEKKKIESLKK